MRSPSTRCCPRCRRSVEGLGVTGGQRPPAYVISVYLLRYRRRIAALWPAVGPVRAQGRAGAGALCLCRCCRSAAGWRRALRCCWRCVSGMGWPARRIGRDRRGGDPRSVRGRRDGEAAVADLPRLHDRADQSRRRWGPAIAAIAGWRSIFIVLAVMGIVMLLWLRRLPETLAPADVRPLDLRDDDRGLGDGDAAPPRGGLYDRLGDDAGRALRLSQQQRTDHRR
jgi:hypothetical protein